MNTNNNNLGIRVFLLTLLMFPFAGAFGDWSVPEELVAGNVDVAIVGVPSNSSSGVRDAGWAPDEMRALNTIATPDLQSLIKPFEVLSVVDYGDFSVDQMSIELSIGHVTKIVARLCSRIPN